MRRIRETFLCILRRSTKLFQPIGGLEIVDVTALVRNTGRLHAIAVRSAGDDSWTRGLGLPWKRGGVFERNQLTRLQCVFGRWKERYVVHGRCRYLVKFCNLRIYYSEQ